MVTVLAGGNVVMLYYALLECDPAPSSMTLVLGIHTEDGILLVSDSQVTGIQMSPVCFNKRKQKLHTFGRYGVGFAGWTGVTNDILRRLQEAEIPESSPGIDEAEIAIRELLTPGFQKCFGGKTTHWPSADVMLAGYKADGISPAIRCLCAAAQNAHPESTWRTKADA